MRDPFPDGARLDARQPDGGLRGAFSSRRATAGAVVRFFGIARCPESLDAVELLHDGEAKLVFLEDRDLPQQHPAIVLESVALDEQVADFVDLVRGWHDDIEAGAASQASERDGQTGAAPDPSSMA